MNSIKHGLTIVKLFEIFGEIKQNVSYLIFMEVVNVQNKMDPSNILAHIWLLLWYPHMSKIID